MIGSRLSTWPRIVRRTLLAVFAMTIVVSAVSSSAAAGESPADFIRILGAQGLEVIRSDATLGQKATYFRQMLRQDFDLPDMCRFVLGPYWRVASYHQKREFRGLFEEHLLRFYGEPLAQYGGESFTVTGTRADPDGLNRDEPDHSIPRSADRHRLAA
jgi:ABC-type transporter MlaC component